MYIDIDIDIYVEPSNYNQYLVANWNHPAFGSGKGHMFL